ncbi:MAG TPA: hypothetical protein DIV86_01920 [Alphaproteobacteria bacterium]|nr:hypothetical protein [Alphaproteobacteria bacterium]
MLEEKIHNLIEPVINQLGLNLVLVKIKGNIKGKILQVLLERADGGSVNVENCQHVTRSISSLLDVENVFSDRYYLEVSSAGLERPLVKKADFEKYTGFLIALKLRLQHPDFASKRFKGRLKSFNDEGFTIYDEERKQDIFTEFYNLDDAKLVVTDEMFKSKGARN